MLHVPGSKTRRGEAALSFCALHMWLELPEHRRPAETVSSFKPDCKTRLFSVALNKYIHNLFYYLLLLFIAFILLN